MISIKIEVMSGLHSGANWAFGNGEISIGGNSQCSVFLCDEVLPDFCLRLKVIGNRVLLKEVNPGLQGAAELVGREGKWVYPDQVFMLEYEGVKFSVSVVDQSTVILARIANAFRKRVHGTLELVQGMGIQLVLGISFCLGLLSTVTVLFLGTVGGNNVQAKEHKSLEQATEVEVTAKPNQVIDSVRQELIRFSESQRASYTVLEINDDSVNLSAEFTRIQMRNFENLIQNLARDYGANVAITAKLSLSPEQKLVDEIDIQSVSFGSQPVVMLRTGERLFLDASYNDLRLVKVASNAIVLQGKSATYELPL